MTRFRRSKKYSLVWWAFIMPHMFLCLSVFATNNQSDAVKELLSANSESYMQANNSSASGSATLGQVESLATKSPVKVSEPTSKFNLNIASKEKPNKLLVSNAPVVKTAQDNPMKALLSDVGESSETINPNDMTESSGKDDAQFKQEVLEFAPQAGHDQSSSGDQMSLEQQAFANTLKSNIPLTPEQITKLKELFDQSQRAASAYPGAPPKPTSTSILVNLSPGATPPIIRLRSGYVSSLVFVDSTGEPWPVVAYDLGDPSSFNIQPTELDGKNNTLLIQALTNHKTGNIAVMLKGHSAPVMISLLTGQGAVDYRVDLRVPGLGPNAQPYFNGLPSVGNKKLITFLDGIPPQGSQPLTVDGADAEAWLYENNIYLRTRLTLLSPSWVATMSSPDGTRVYELVKTPLVLMSSHGRIVRVMIKGLE